MRPHHIASSAALLAASVAAAAPVAVENHSFEAAAGYWGATGWSNTAVGNDAVVEIQTGAFAGKDGNNFLNLAITGSDGTPPLSTHAVFSATAGQFQPETTYTLIVAIGHAFDWNPSDAMIAHIGLATGTTFGSIVALDSYSLRTDGSEGDYITYNSLSDRTFTYTTGASGGPVGEDLHVVLQFTHDAQWYRSVRFDNVRLDATAIPEPATVGLIATAGMLVLRRRRHHP